MLAWAFALGLASATSAALAHGPTVRVAYSGVRPSTLSIEAGSTVHFVNSNASGGICTVVAEDGSFESPPMGRSEGWHYTFEEPGTYRFRVKEMSGKSGTIVVAPKRE